MNRKLLNDHFFETSARITDSQRVIERKVQAEAPQARMCCIDDPVYVVPSKRNPKGSRIAKPDSWGRRCHLGPGLGAIKGKLNAFFIDHEQFLIGYAKKRAPCGIGQRST